MNRVLLRRTIEQAATRIVRRQRVDGAFAFCCEVSPLSDAVMVIFLCLLGRESDPLVPRLCQELLRRQNSDGGWTAYPDQPDNLSATTLALFALRLAGYPLHTPAMAATKRYIRDRGGIAATSNLTKVILATAGQLSWDHLPKGHIEVALLGTAAPVNVYDFASFARLHLAPYMVLTHLRFQYPVPREKGISDLFLPSITLPKIHLPCRNEPALRRCEQLILERLEPNGTLASYLTATVFAVFALQALGYRAQHPVVQRAVNGLKEMVYVRRRWVHPQIFTSTVWDTALSLQALQATRLPACADPIRHGVRYLLSRQQDRLSDWSVHAPDVKPGGWGFSDVNTLYPDLDDTIATLKALHPVRRWFPSHWKKGVAWVLGMQNNDGGWAAFERNCNKGWLEHLPINDMGRAMIDPSTADLTGRVLEGLTTIGACPPDHREKAVRWLLKRQRSDGSWYGRWGICFIYGTWAALIGLRAAGVPTHHQVIRKAVAWLQRIQNDDGGFGESCSSDAADRYVPLGQSTVSQTAWALLALMAGSSHETAEINAAAAYLLSTADPRGGWRETYPTGAGIAGQAHLRYHSYPYVWPLLALCRYTDRFGDG